MRKVMPFVLSLAALAACQTDDQSFTGPRPDRPSREVAPNATTGAVYTLSNAAEGNAVLVFLRAADGTLSAGPSVSTGGLGLGAGLGSQSALARSPNGLFLLAVNAGSDELSALRLNGTTPTFASKVASGGDQPVSVAVRGSLVYVLNAGANNNITGFRISETTGALTPIPGSTRALSAPNAGGAQIAFTPRGDALVVTEKATNRILSYRVAASGVATPPTITPSAGTTPFGFSFGGAFGDVLLVSEAFGGAPNASAVSSYKVGATGALTLVSASVPTHQTAACWVVPTKDKHFAFVTNTGSASISGYKVEAGGALTLSPATGIAASSGAGPIDEDVTADGVFLYALASGSHEINGYTIGAGTSVTPGASVGGLPPAAAGLVAR